MLFDKLHIMYIVFSLTSTIGILAGGYFIKKDRWRNWFLFFFGLGSLLIHLSQMYYDLFTNYIDKEGIIGYYTQIVPYWPCNFFSLFIAILALIKNKNTFFWRHFAIFSAWGGIFGSLVATFYPTFYILASEAKKESYDTYKSMFSHTFLLIGCLYLYVGKFVKLRVSNVLSWLAGSACLMIIGLMLIGLFKISEYKYKLVFTTSVLFILESPVEEVPWLIGPMMSLLVAPIIFLAGLIAELFLPKEQRFFKTAPIVWNSFKTKLANSKVKKDKKETKEIK